MTCPRVKKEKNPEDTVSPGFSYVLLWEKSVRSDGFLFDMK